MLQGLKQYLTTWAGDDKSRVDVADTINRITIGAVQLAKEIALPTLDGSESSVIGENTDGDAQKVLDVRADEMFMDAMKGGAIRLYGSEEAELPVEINKDAPLALAIDPLDGSSNIETNGTVGTIFSILPIGKISAESTFGQAGDAQLAAGFVAYGPRTQMFLTLGQGTLLLQLDFEHSDFVIINDNVQIEKYTSEFAINVSNYRHWDDGIRTYIDDCFDGEEGARERNFNMRWLASLVADATRIFARGGVFLYPGDIRPTYKEGRLRLVYEAFPLAFLVEQAGGCASTGTVRILDLIPRQLHERIPLIFGSKDEIEHIEKIIANPSSSKGKSPLFGNQGLFRR
ncbi:MAG: class 1 fructose-bisphosphatase [Rhizobiaceae bacterium]